MKKGVKMSNFEIVKDYYNWDNDPRREAPNGCLLYTSDAADE